ncbi:MAG: hypothetical protein QOJ64_4214 [Acidobacteriota bacterium]|jgi:hypothetical protein|nr:hypothetical protein [Acidobacteriota bacterium]
MARRLLALPELLQSLAAGASYANVLKPRREPSYDSNFASPDIECSRQYSYELVVSGSVDRRRLDPYSERSIVFAIGKAERGAWRNSHSKLEYAFLFGERDHKTFARDLFSITDQ